MLEILKNRFQGHMNLHPELQWADVENRLREKPDVMEVLRKMEKSGFFATAQKSRLPGEEVCAMMMKLSKSGRKIRPLGALKRRLRRSEFCC